MKLSLERRNTAIFGTGILLLLLLAGVTRWNYNRLGDTFEQVAHEQGELALGDSVMIDVLSLESAARGYVATGEARFLQAHAASLAHLQAVLPRLRESEAGHPEVRGRIGELAELVNRRAAITQKQLAARTAGGAEAGARAILEGGGEQVTGQIRRLLREISLADLSKLAQHQSAAYTITVQSIRLVTAICALGLLLAGGAVWVVRRDFARRGEAERELGKSHAMFSTLFEEAADGLVVADRAGRIARVNRTAEKLFGYTRAELLGRPVELLMPEAARAGHAAQRENFQAAPRLRAMGGGLDLHARRKDGSVFPVDIMLTPLETAEGPMVLATVRDISERRQAETALLRTQARLQHLLAVTPGAIYSCQASGGHTATFVSDNVQALLGHTPREFAEIPGFWVEGIHPDDRARVLADMPEVFRTGTHAHEYRFRHKNGAYRWLHDEVRLVRSADGEPQELVGLILDVTESKEADDALRLSETRLREAQSIAHIGSWHRDLTSNDVIWSDEVYRIFGYAPGQIAPTYAAFLERVHPLDRARLMAVVPAAARAAAPYSVDYRIVLPDGRERIVQATGRVARDAAGRPLSTTGTVQDITERKRAEQQIREQAELLKQTHDAIMVTGLDDRFTFWNEGAERITGWPAAAALGQTAETIFGSSARLAVIREAVMTAGTWQGEMPVHRKDGQPIVLDLSVSLIHDAEGRPKARLTIGTDITGQKQLAEQALRAQRIETLGMLSAGIAHDFNNALAPILMSAPLLQRQLPEGPGRRILAIMEKSAERSVRLVRQLLAFARGADGQSQPVPVHLVLREVLELVEATFPKSIRCEPQVPGNLWPVQGGPTQLHQVFLNLCVNARDAMPQGGALTVTAQNCALDVAAAAGIPDARAGNFVVVEVRDTGTGIAPEVLEHIWEPFFTTKGEGRGTGLGLSTVRGILHQHGGFATVQTQAGQGTVFAVYLPAAADPLTAGAAGQAAPAPRGEGELVLVADDEELVRELIVSILAAHGYRTVTAADGVEAIRVFASCSGEVRLVLTDTQMPLMSGLELAAALRVQKPGLPVVAMSGVGSGSASGLGETTTAFLAKPFQVETLLSIVHRALHGPPA
jgi:PAS domain S-box-containing protein